ncbi:Serine/threonine-protein phosphatase 7 long form-like [Vitis vinifera]|uniref:Serine/threonine-protein phosphatase 7 long form-like n=1 Tax=Vitis vinifera TaxID=29760 RepID=A0A438KMK5_VITVI|nr:Serine/threonine-protein phosphatase 7 long form-like [Vitis vinifera]
MKWIGDNQVSKSDVGFVNRRVTIIKNILTEGSLLTQLLNDVEGNDPGKLHCRRREASFYLNSILSARIIPYLQQFGFYGVTRLGLSIDGVVFSGSTCLDWKEVCATLLGVVPEDRYISGQRLHLTWLTEHFPSLAPDIDVEYVRCYAKAFILQFIGGFLLADKSNNKIHLWTGPDSLNIGHCDEIHQLCATTSKAIHKVDRLFIPLNVVDIERQSSDEEVVMRDGGVQTRSGGVRTRSGGVRTKDGEVWTRGGWDTDQREMIRFKIKEVDEEGVEVEEMEQY